MAALDLSWFGGVDLAALSLPVLTVVLAILDSFNPCAFFVLLFLLSLVVHAGSRARMLLIGGLFVTVSGLVYFVFMAAWLNVFLVIGHFQAVTLVAGAVAVLIALVNIKDFFWFGQGPRLAIPEGAKPKLFARMRALLGAPGLVPVLIGTITLALAANSYELLCTAGFPMVFTRILTLRDVSAEGRYLYLGLYNLVYVVPLFAIVAAFVATLGTRKLTEWEGRVMKLLSGLLMLGLGLLLLIDPERLNSLVTSLGILGAAGAATYGIARFHKSGRPRPSG